MARMSGWEDRCSLFKSPPFDRRGEPALTCQLSLFHMHPTFQAGRGSNRRDTPTEPLPQTLAPCQPSALGYGASKSVIWDAGEEERRGWQEVAGSEEEEDPNKVANETPPQIIPTTAASGAASTPSSGWFPGFPQRGTSRPPPCRPAKEQRGMLKWGGGKGSYAEEPTEDGRWPQSSLPGVCPTCSSRAALNREMRGK